MHVIFAFTVFGVCVWFLFVVVVVFVLFCFLGWAGAVVFKQDLWSCKHRSATKFKQQNETRSQQLTLAPEQSCWVQTTDPLPCLLTLPLKLKESKTHHTHTHTHIHTCTHTPTTHTHTHTHTPTNHIHTHKHTCTHTHTNTHQVWKASRCMPVGKALHGFHTFSRFGPHIWNSLPQDLRHSSTLSASKAKLKTWDSSVHRASDGKARHNTDVTLR